MFTDRQKHGENRKSTEREKEKERGKLAGVDDLITIEGRGA